MRPMPMQVEEFAIPRFDRKLSDYINPVIAAGLRLEEIREPRAPESACELYPEAFHKISRSHPAVPLRSRIEAVRQKMIRALIGILACVMLAGCGAQGEPYQPRATPASQSVIYVYRPYGLLSSQTNPMITCGHDSIELELPAFTSSSLTADR